MQNQSRRLLRFKTRAQRQKLFSLMLKASLIGVVLFFILASVIFAVLSRNLPEPGKVIRREGFSTVFYDRNGKVLYEMFEDKNRIPVQFNDIPKNLRNATVAIEDKNFYRHKGFSLWGIARAFITIVTRGRLAGGSTLTQQLVKNVLLTKERTVTRKVKELVLAVAIEDRFTKDQILEMYLNEAPYGGTYWGVQSASKGYFNKDVKDLNLIESAVLAGLPQSPTVYNPISGAPNAYKGRTKSVLRRMREEEYITRDQEKKSLADLDNVKFESENLTINAPHFVFYVRDQVIKEFGPKILDEGIKITTTLDYDIQKQAQEIVKEEVEKLKPYKASNASAVVLDSKTGEVLAMVGSFDFTNKEFGQFNVATALRQPGSAVKPITYATAFEQGFTPGSLIMDVQTEFPDQGGKVYAPVNYDGKFRGPAQYRFALANSYNIPAVKVLANVGIKNFLQKAYDMGLVELQPNARNLKRFGLAITLGGGETTLLNLTSAYSVFAREGKRVEPSSIIDIKDYKNKTIYKQRKPSERQVVSKESSFLIAHILSDSNARADAFGARSYLVVPGKTVAVKTGTTNDKRDNWTLGWTKDVTVGVWVGNNDNSPMNAKIASGITGASPIWNRIMRELLKKYKDGIMDKPDNVEALQIDSLLGGLPKDANPTRSEYFIKGTEPTDTATFYKKLKLSRSTGKLANDVEIKSGDYDEKDFIVLTENDPVSTDGRNRWQEGIDAWINQQGDDRYKAPKETSDNKGDEVIVSIKEPQNTSRTESNDIRVKAKIITLYSVRKVEIFANSNKLKEYNEDKKDIDEQFNLPDGTYEIRIRAENEKGKSGESSVRIGIKKDWNYQEPTTAPTATPTPPLETPSPTPTPLLP
ncbi:hypothetical protein A2957_02195 [Candidatus Roizmanbacteria bacterium RIFCSPLOWO2_01_FULL_38_11]|uniref:Uncharacterized protein n=1 Tax=Candidatus Roizmanbacteria bacterium RIFCSPLOWO2_01_FULL_38_11 TaxID=1802060 RepID=A0A1F7INX8_9BACT|nr:MAG: hypothetical protein A2957_02195 [Candidatus Roizmanbacteria bacterium RIFCSPLOWO2_01_FULL_38_11]